MGLFRQRIFFHRAVRRTDECKKRKRERDSQNARVWKHDFQDEKRSSFLPRDLVTPVLEALREITRLIPAWTRTGGKRRGNEDIVDEIERHR